MYPPSDHLASDSKLITLGFFRINPSVKSVESVHLGVLVSIAKYYELHSSLYILNPFRPRDNFRTLLLLYGGGMKRYALFSGIALGVVSCIALSSPANAQIQLITNGGFETGTYAGWNPLCEDGCQNAPAGGSDGGLFVTGANAGPLSGEPTVGPAAGSFYSVSDQLGPGAYSLSQAITVAAGATSVILSWDMFVDQYSANPAATPGALDFKGPPVEFGTADLLAGTADPFSTGAGVLANFYTGADAQVNNPNAYTHYTEDITSLVDGGGTFLVRFGEADNQGFFNQGIDNVSVLETVSPEPASFLLIAPALGALLAFKRKYKKA
jgi:hypothetical protein